MSHYEERLERDLTEIRENLSRIGTQVEAGLEGSLRALFDHDRRLASETILGDMPINRAIRAMDRRCHAFVARHLPSAGHLRLVSSVLRLNIALERIGDYAVKISREVVQLSSAPPTELARDVHEMADHAKHLLHEALQAFHEGDAVRAQSTIESMAGRGTGFPRALADLLRAGEGEARPLGDLFALLVIFNALDRVADQAKNVCEETVFTVTGKTKEPKVYRILFVDRSNDRESQMAEALARKLYPGSGQYESAGWEPAAEVDATYRQFMEQHGLAASSARPDALDQSRDALRKHHVIVALDQSAYEHLREIPFQTVLLDWELESGDAEATYRELSHRLQGLMQILRGEEAG